jgi:hypothetical protein
MDIDEARALLETVVKGKLAGEEIIKAIEVVLRSYDAILNNLVILEDKFDGSAEEKVEDLTRKLEKQKQIKAEMRKVAYEEGYIQGFNKCREKIMYMEVE